MKNAEHICTVFGSLEHDSLAAGVGPGDVTVRDPRKLDLIVGGGGFTPVGDGAIGVAKGIVICQLVPWQFDYKKAYNLKRTYRCTSTLIARLLGNMGARSKVPLLDRFSKGSGDNKSPWLTSYYLDVPEEFDDPYRFFGW